HFIRSAEIVRSLAKAGCDVCFLNGGEIVPGFELPAAVEMINLSPLKADAEFRDIQTIDGLGLDEIKEMRKRRIIDEYERLVPEVLVIELFPFGRLRFGDELIPLLELAKFSGRFTEVVCSLRDILVGKRAQRQFEEYACQIVNRYFDLLLVHSDPSFQRLEETFPRVADLECPVVYTGFVKQPLDEESGPIDDLPAAHFGEKTIVVSIGGGRVGIELIDCAIEASALLAGGLRHRMFIFTGPYMSEAEFGQLQEKTAKAPGIRMERYTTRFISYLRRADLSISMAGYNTCMNIVATGARAIVYPFTGNNNAEQSIRADKLSTLGIVDVIRRQELKPGNLAEMIVAALSRPEHENPVLDLNGAEKTAMLLAHR
ncbi:MAG: glycosyl transferase, partial [Blastocatellia bacterium]|nr:glycosyl transferase [Blastocatellia bacterium]